MKNPLLIVAAILIFLFFLSLFLSKGSFRKTFFSQKRTEQNKTVQNSIEKERVRRFWETYRKATDHRMAGRLKEASEDYQTALSINDKHEDALYYLGNIYLELGYYKDAEDAWKKLIQINPHSARAHLQLGDLYLSLERDEPVNIEASKAEYHRALEINKEETAPLLRLGQIALIQNDLSIAQHYFDAVTKSNFKSVEAHFLKGYIAWKQGNKQKALSLLSESAKHSQPTEPIKGVLSEGDTKTGRAHNLSGRPNHKTLFHDHFVDLTRIDKLSLSQQTGDRYQKLDTFLEQIRRETQ